MNYTSFNVVTGDKCGICYEAMEANTDTVKHKKGGKKHPLHRECIKEWLLRSDKCPTCSVTVNPKSLLTLKDRIVKELKNIKNNALKGADIGMCLAVGSGIKHIIQERLAFPVRTLPNLCLALPLSYLGGTGIGWITDNLNELGERMPFRAGVLKVAGIVGLCILNDILMGNQDPLNFFAVPITMGIGAGLGAVTGIFKRAIFG